MRVNPKLSFFLLGATLLLLLGGYGYGVRRGMIALDRLVLFYAAMSLLTIVIYFRDKAAARFDERRTPESVLHLLEMGGGWPGALLAQLFFWHKIRKASYQLVFWLIVAVHAAGLYLFYSGQLHLESLSAMPSIRIQALAPKLNVPERLASLFKTESASAPQEPAPEEPASQAAVAPETPSLEELFAQDAPTGPAVANRGAPRSIQRAHKQSRQCQGEVKAISRSRGVLVDLPPDLGGQGIISPRTLVPDFQRRFRVGEQVTVAVQGVSMKGRQKTFSLLLVEP